MVTEQLAATIEEMDLRWRDKHGFVNIKAPDNVNIDNENPTLFSAQYLLMLHQLGALEGNLRTRMMEWAEAATDSLRLAPGIFDRTPETRSVDRDNVCIRHFSRDEQIGLLILDHIFGRTLGLSDELYTHGKNSSWFFENRVWRNTGNQGDFVCHHGDWLPATSPEALSQGFRSPKFQGLLAISTGRSPSDIEVAEIVGGLAVTATAPRSETSGRILAVLRSHILLRSSNTAIKFSVKAFLIHLRREYGKNYLRTLYSIYFTNSDHPFHRLVAL